MKKGSTILLIEICCLILLFTLNNFLFKITNVYLISAILGLFLCTTYFFVGGEKNNFRNKKDVLITIIINIGIYFLITYVLGIFTGFIKNGYSLKVMDIFKNIFPYLILIIVRELFRYLYVAKVNKNKLLMILGILFFILLDINLNLNNYSMTTVLGFTKILCLVIFPSLAKNILLCYITVKVGYSNAIIYSLIMELKYYILPIFPDLGEYITTLIDVIFPLYLTIKIYNNFRFFEDRKIKSSRYRSNNMLFYSAIVFILVLVVTLTSGYFKYYALTIGSGSMGKTISKGDIVIVKKLKQNEINKLKLKDILVYKYNGKIIVHRLVEIKRINGNDFYITKGDNNLTKDAYYIKQKDVIGKVSFKVKYLGMPTVALNEKINR